MAVWRSPGLESLFGGPLDETGITESTLARLVTEGAVESEQLDFKRDLYPTTKGAAPPWSSEQEFAKDVSAFANYRGGVILVGVEDTNGVATGLAPMPAPVSAEHEERRLRQALLNYQAPLALCSFIWIATAASGDLYLAVIVPPSVRAPHAVLGQRGNSRQPLHYPHRHGADTGWLSEAEVAERYRRRVEFQQDHGARVERTVASGHEALRRTNGVWLYAAAVPEVPVSGKLDGATVRSIEGWHQSAPLISPLGRSLGAFGRGIPAPGRVTFTGSRSSVMDDETEIHSAYLELHVDGSAFAATPVAFNGNGDPGGREIGEFTLVDDAIVALDVALRWCAHQAGSWGTASVVLGLVDCEAADGALGAPVSLVTNEHGSVRRIRGTRAVTGRPETATVADLANIDTVQQRLSVTYHALAGLLQWFGLPEPAQLTSDGNVIARQFGMSSYREVVNWAAAFDVDVERVRGDR